MWHNVSTSFISRQEPAPKAGADAIRRKVTRRVTKVSLRRHPVPARQEQDLISTTPSIRHVAQPPTHTTTAELSRRLNDSSRIIAFGTPSKQRPVHASTTSAASPAPPSVPACAAPILVGATPDRPRAAASGGVHALA
ncbi:hypothetical protein V502_03746 [Pseudogymnoascus sp. VKM F-4520 (FW-2644)]|nr:hypothetical protein V502_03746 [Pseudogymnoascus sp. VKM F-4520 (FW-2644)]